ncbi:hypothetical protein DEO72_LG9g1453 [Vigna unguiculata]|uniref:Uncharacterized protein n=1 Tax=Vigna unguiculata TaxID=3917 RepID=A0A4D6N0R3_VIGUN|nr:hypothetical protein DEO72_LG9g1453 [Vigna unguiculata]
MHDLDLKTKRAEFVLSPLSFSTSRKIIITPYSYASICNLSAVTSCIYASTCNPSNGHSFTFPFLNIKRRSFPPFQLPPLTIFSPPSHSSHSSFSPPNILRNRHSLSPENLMAMSHEDMLKRARQLKRQKTSTPGASPSAPPPPRIELHEETSEPDLEALTRRSRARGKRVVESTSQHSTSQTPIAPLHTVEDTELSFWHP